MVFLRVETEIESDCLREMTIVFSTRLVITPYRGNDTFFAFLEYTCVQTSRGHASSPCGVVRLELFMKVGKICQIVAFKKTFCYTWMKYFSKLDCF